MNEIVYVGTDLEGMSFAENYHKWILDEFRPFLGRSVVEVGAGTGDFSKLLLAEDPEFLTLVEPSEMFLQLRKNVVSTKTNIKLHRCIFADAATVICESQKPDSILYINVLEHIENDVNELKLVHQCLAPHGKVLIFVPALPQLYGKFDSKIGHHRRYIKGEIVGKVESAGFRILEAKYFDFVGIIPWFIKYKIFRSDSLDGKSVKLYDRLAVPINRFLESVVTPPIGKNLLIAGEKI